MSNKQFEPHVGAKRSGLGGGVNLGTGQMCLVIKDMCLIELVNNGELSTARGYRAPKPEKHCPWASSGGG